MSTPQERHPGVLRECVKCQRIAPPEGGVERGPGRWQCGNCWRLFASARKPALKKRPSK